jgi:hypothetical protein
MAQTMYAYMNKQIKKEEEGKKKTLHMGLLTISPSCLQKDSNGEGDCI